MSGPFVMPFMNSKALPIMSFKTDKNGTFDPSFTIASGVLRWIIDGEEFETNSPSKALTGSEVDVEVFANTVPQNAVSTDVIFDTENIIGELGFEWFTINTNFNIKSNLGLTSFKLSTNNNEASNIRVDGCNFATIDLSKIKVIAGTCIGNNNINATSVIFKAGVAQVGQTFRFVNCNFTSIDLSDFTMTFDYRLNSNTGLASITSPLYATSLTVLNHSNCALPVSEIDKIFSELNTFMSSNTPTNNLTVTLNGGTNASPTGGSSNTDLVNLRDVVYPAAGFTFTPVIN